MTEAAIPFANLQESGFEELGGASPVAMNVVIDAKGVVSKRPGINASQFYPGVVNASGLGGVFVGINGDMWAIADTTGERPIYRVTPGGSAVLNGGLPPAGSYGDRRPVFAETELLIVVAGGREIEKIVKDDLASARLGGTPPLASHIVAINNRLLANDVFADLTKVRFSDVALGDTDYSGHEEWDLGGVGTSGYFTAEARPDNVVALAENTGEVWVFGQTTLQTFGPSEEPSSPFVPVSTIELGCGAPYSVVKVDGDFYWIDQKRRIVKSSGRGHEILSDGIQRTLDAMETTADAFGYHVTLGFLDAMVWTFPTDGRTFVFQKGVGWGQWAGYSGGAWTQLLASAVCLSPFDGTAFVGTSTGRVGSYSLDNTTDFGDPIVASVTTGYLNRDTSAMKFCRGVKVSARRGASSSTPGPQGVLRWRDRPGAWEGQIPIDFGSSGDRETVLHFPALGTYRSRQWQFEFGESSQMALVSVTEEFDVLPV